MTAPPNPPAAGARRAAIVVAGLATLVALAASPLWQSPWPATHEGIAPLERTLAAAHEIGNGTWYPRWLSLADGGKGSAFGNFYSPGVHVLAGHLAARGASVPDALRLVVLAALAAGAVGAWVWTRRALGDAGAFAAAALYLLAPYHLLDLYVRGAVAELLALGILPWLFAAIDLSIERPRAGTAAVALASAGVVLAHNLTALMIAPFAAAWVAWRAWTSREGLRTALSPVSGALLGAALSAFYWLPALAEQRHLLAFQATVTQGPWSYATHFVYPSQLIRLEWGRGFSVAGPEDGLSFQLGLAQLMAALGGLGALWRRGPTAARALAGAGLAGTLVALLLATPASALLYDALPVLATVQFPWRFLGPASLFVAALGGAGVAAAGRGATLAAAAIVAVVVIQSGEHRRAIPLPEAEIFTRPELVARAVEGRLLGKLCVADEYLPRWARAASRRSFPPGPPRPASPTARIGPSMVAGARLQFEAAGEAPLSSIEIPWYYFPGWTATVDGGPAPVAPSAEGFLTVAIPPGRHVVEVAFGPTPLRRAAAAITAAGLAALAALTVQGIRARRRRAAAPAR
jgi:hypothetical protein